MTPIIKTIIEGVIVLFIAIAAHELGHYQYSKYLKKKFKLINFWLRGTVDVKGLTKNQIKGIYEVGIVYGGLVVLFANIILENYWHLVTFVLYIYGCKSDIGHIRALDVIL